MIQFIAINVTTDVIKPDQECHVNVINQYFLKILNSGNYIFFQITEKQSEYQEQSEYEKNNKRCAHIIKH